MWRIDFLPSPISTHQRLDACGARHQPRGPRPPRQPPCHAAQTPALAQPEGQDRAGGLRPQLGEGDNDARTCVYSAGARHTSTGTWCKPNSAKQAAGLQPSSHGPWTCSPAATSFLTLQNTQHIVVPHPAEAQPHGGGPGGHSAAQQRRRRDPPRRLKHRGGAQARAL
jgi:hypothetical protein